MPGGGTAALGSGSGARRLDEGRLSTPLAVGWSLALVAYAGAALWVAAHEPALSSDDALFLARGLTRFSVLDFSPQFPGYPGVVAMGRLILPLAGDPLRALAFVTGLLALALPPLAALVAKRAGAGEGAALAAFAVTLAGPLMPDLALSLLSDGAGIFFLLVFLALLPRRGEEARTASALLAGMALGWAAACRPSDAPMLAGAALGALVMVPRLFGPLLVGGLVVVLPIATVIWALEGPLYLEEGLRFVTGHALIWGNTAFAEVARHGGWLDALGATPGGLALAALFLAGAGHTLRQRRGAAPALMAASAAFIAHAGWVAAFQNPDHLRHLAPLAVLGGLLLATAWAGTGHRLAWLPVGLCLALEGWALIGTVAPLPGRASPLASAIDLLAKEPPGAAVATNDGVFLLRAKLPGLRVYDMHYPADARLGLATAAGPAFRLTGTPLPGRSASAVFPARFAGETTLFLYRMGS